MTSPHAAAPHTSRAPTCAAPIRVGLIGLGRWGAVYVRTIQAMPTQCRLTHLCTSDSSKARDLPPAVTVVSHWDQVIAADCDAVIIATPPATHPEIVEACLNARRPCVVEKPLCLDVSTAERLHARSSASGVPVLVNHVHLFDPFYMALKQATLESGEPIQLIVSEGSDLGPFRPETSALWDWGPHEVSLCLDLMGCPPHAVDALGTRPGPSGAPEAIGMRLDFPGGGSAWVHTGAIGPRKRRTLSVFTAQHLYQWEGGTSPRVTVAPFDFANRYANSFPPDITESSLTPPGTDTPEALLGATPSIGGASPPVASMTPMTSMLGTFVQGLTGGSQERFGTTLALEVTRVLATCEQAMQRVPLGTGFPEALLGATPSIGGACPQRQIREPSMGHAKVDAARPYL